MSKVKKLKPSELTTINYNHERLAAQNLRTLMLEKDRKLLEMRQEVLRSQIAMLNSEIEKLNNKYFAEKSKGEVIQRENKEYIDKVKKQHKINGSFGFDPETGEIRED